MLITALTPAGKSKTRVELDEERTIVLSNRELAEYGIREGEELPDGTLAEIMQSFRERILKKCGSLLSGGDYTSRGLYDRLVRSGFPEETAEEAVRQMEEAGYLDDRRYAENYLRYYGESRSRGRCRMDLLAKGISADLVDEVMNRLEEEDGCTVFRREIGQIHALMEKRHYDPDHASWEDEQKLKGFLMRKGYSSDVIRAALRSEEHTIVPTDS